MSKDSCVLAVEHLSVTFRQYEHLIKQVDLPVITDLSLSVHAGEMVAVVGASGSGKSLLAHAIMGLLPYNATCGGAVYYRGEELSEARMKKLRGHEIVLVPQSVSYMDPLMKAGAQVRKGSRKEADKRRSREVLGRYGLGEETDSLYPFELSGGMTRRVLISAAVMESPKLVIADEPTPGLHIQAARRVLSHFREMAEDGAGVLLITHDLELAVECADRIVVFYAGTNVEEAKAADFNAESSLRHPYTKALYRAMPEHGFGMVGGSQPYVKDMPPGCLYAPRCENVSEKCTQGQIPLIQVDGGMVRCVKYESSSQ